MVPPARLIRLWLLLALTACGNTSGSPPDLGAAGSSADEPDGSGGAPRSDRDASIGVADAAVEPGDASAMIGPESGPDVAGLAADAAAPTASPACGMGLPAPAEGVHTLALGAMTRKFFLRLPASYDGQKPWPVIFAFHGAGNKSAAWFDTNTDLRAQTEEKAILVFPEGPAKPDGSLSWVYLSPDNVLFVDAMIDWLKKSLCLDPSRLFATGQSSGGYMAMTLGCQRGTVFRAVATSSGGILEPGPCTGNPHVLMRTGRADTAATHDSVVKTRDFWTMHKACGATPPRPIQPAPCVSYADCGGATVIWCEDGGSHGWPSYATRAMWDLFSM
jgi:polyhydroxybutyrate depolymerase